MIFCILLLSIVTSPFTFLVLSVWILSLFLLISPANLNENLALIQEEFYSGRIFLVVGFSSSLAEIYHAIPFWPTELLLKSQLIALREFPHLFFCCFSLVAFNTLLFAIYSESCVSLWVDSVWDSLLSGLGCVFSFPGYGRFAAIMSSSMFSVPPSVLSLWDPCTMNISVLDVVAEVSYTVLVSFLFPVQHR